jgi:hypothetical protein
MVHPHSPSRLLRVSLPYPLFRMVEAGEITPDQFAQRARRASAQLDKLQADTMTQTRGFLRDLDKEVRANILQNADADALGRSDINRAIDRAVDQFVDQRRSTMQRSTQRAVDLSQDFRQKIAGIAKQPAPQAAVPPKLAQDLAEIQGDANQALGDSIRKRLKLKVAQGLQQGKTPRQIAGEIVAERIVTPSRKPGDPAQRGAVGKVQTQTTTELRRTFNTAGFAAGRAEQKTKAGILKTWVPKDAGANRRPGHQEAGRRYAIGGNPGPIPFNQSFVVNGVKLRFPNDPAGPIEETANCECIVVEIVPEVGEKLAS